MMNVSMSLTKKDANLQNVALLTSEFVHNVPF